jgi:hypothetical protein
METNCVFFAVRTEFIIYMSLVEKTKQRVSEPHSVGVHSSYRKRFCAGQTEDVRVGKQKCLTQLIHWSLTRKGATRIAKQSEKEEFNNAIER